MTDTLLEQLRRVRADHEAELAAHRFLLEAYSGTGGFAPSMSAPPASWWGAAAVDYAASGTLWSRDGKTPETRLDRYPREDTEKFGRRAQVAHYANYVDVLTDLKCSYVLREQFVSHDEPKATAEWKRNVDGDETTWGDWLPDVVSEAAVLGWAPVLIDSAPIAEGLSLAQAGDVAGPSLRPLFPSQLLEWSAQGKRFEWLKIRTDHVEQDGWNSKPVQVERYAIWTPDDVTVYRVVKRDGEEPTVEAPVAMRHGFGRVPIAILRHASGGDPLRGRPMHWSVAQEARRLFNLHSELDEHIRSQVFAILLVPGRQTAPGGQVDLGTENGLNIDQDAKNVPYYLAPPASVAETLEKRIESTIREIYRLARVEFTRTTGGAAVSGVAKEYEFEQTNRALGDFAKQIALFSLDVADIVGAGLGVEREARRKHLIDPPRSFAVQDLERDIKVAMDATTLSLGTTATARIKQHVVRRILPNLSAADQAQIDEELEAEALAEEQARAAAREALADEPDPGDADPAGGDEGADGEDDEPVPPAAKPPVPPGAS